MDEAILLTGSKLAHVHFANSNREALGKDLIDFNSAIKKLKKVKLDKNIIIELLLFAANSSLAQGQSDTKKNLICLYLNL